MQRTRWLLLTLIAAIVAAVAIAYTVQRDTQARNAPAMPTALPESVSARADDWIYEIKDGNRPVVRVFAKDFRQASDGQRLELEHVTLQLYQKDGKAFDEVKSAKADFDRSTGQLFSDGAVEITMGVPADQKKTARLVHIKTSGVKFDIKTGAAFTDRPASFQFDRGEGRSLGARYDPATRELHMHSEVSLTWFGQKPDDKRMTVQAGSLVYLENESKILLTPWAKFRRDALSIDSAGSVVTLVDGAIENIEAFQANGTDSQPKRQVAFEAEELRMRFNPKGAVQSIVGEKNARLTSTATESQTTINSKRVDLDFEAPEADSVLKKALATGGATVEAKPLPGAATPLPETRIVRSATIALYMRSQGEEIDRVETESPGTVEFVPNRAGQKKRLLTGERLYMTYGTANQIRSFRAVQVSTRTESEQPPGKPPLPPALTWSKELLAEFDQNSGDLLKMEQWDDFRYEEGDRRARSQRASFIAPKDDIVLTGAARVWDAAGSTSADAITMNQKNGDFSAEGNVNSTRLSEAGKKQQQGMLSGDEPVHAKAARMNTTDQNTIIRYEGSALMWQGANRLEANRIVIDRKQGLLTGEGNVISQLLDKSDTKKKTPVFTVVKASKMTYSDKERVAHYSGGSSLARANTTVAAQDIRAFLRQGENDSSLDHALADGSVKIVQVTPERTRTGVSEHAEYHTADGRVLLTGGTPELVDTAKGTTRGKQLIYFSNNDRLFVEGAQGQPVDTKLNRN